MTEDIDEYQSYCDDGHDIEWETSEIHYEGLSDQIYMNGACKICGTTGRGRFTLEDWHDD